MDKVEKIIWTDDGISSFESIVQYIYSDSLYYARNFAEKIMSSIEKLKDFPNIGRIVPEYNVPNIREIIYQNYRIVYKTNRNSIHIVLVIHGGRQMPNII